MVWRFLAILNAQQLGFPRLFTAWCALRAVARIPILPSEGLRCVVHDVVTPLPSLRAWPVAQRQNHGRATALSVSRISVI